MYPNNENQNLFKKVIKIEEEKFSNIIQEFSRLWLLLKKLRKTEKKKLLEKLLFKLYDTYGFPYELTEEICEENGIAIYKNEFDRKMEEQKEKARNSREVVMEKGQDAFIEAFFDEHGKTEFTGYRKKALLKLQKFFMYLN